MPPMRHDRISIDPQVMGGKPCIKATRIPVDLLLHEMGDGETIDDLLKAYPHLVREDLFAALKYAAHIILDTYIIDDPEGP